jgi:hypothetical protein
MLMNIELQRGPIDLILAVCCRRRHGRLAALE